MGISKSVAGHGVGGHHTEHVRSRAELNLAGEVKDLLPTAVKANKPRRNARRTLNSGRLRTSVCPICKGDKHPLSTWCRECHFHYRVLKKPLPAKDYTREERPAPVHMGRHARGGRKRVNAPPERVQMGYAPGTGPLKPHQRLCIPSAHAFVAGVCTKCPMTLVEFARMQRRYRTYDSLK